MYCSLNLMFLVKVSSMELTQVLFHAFLTFSLSHDFSSLVHQIRVPSLVLSRFTCLVCLGGSGERRYKSRVSSVRGSTEPLI